MRLLKVVCYSAALTLLANSTLYAKGPRGGPSFESYEWTEIRPTQFFNPLHWEPRAGLQVIRTAKEKDDRLSQWVTSLAERRHPNLAAVALANKTTRIAWAMLRHGTNYEPDYIAA